jgi:glycosyltransferase involved in cell wall biosynthesis
MASYNRADIMKYSIMSVIYQTYKNWELIIIGDCCTDNSKEVADSFKDNRITFINLENNYGEQSYPNTYGMKLAKGQYISFLNHDDIWLPDHLESLLATFQKTQCDMTYSLVGLYGNYNESSVICCSPRNIYEPHIIVPASVWMMKSNIPTEVGYWKSAMGMITFPSEEYIYRIWKAGYNIIPTIKMTMIKPVSTSVKNSYFEKSQINEQIYIQIIEDKNFRENYLINIINNSMSDFSLGIHFKKIIRETIRIISNHISKLFDIHPTLILNIVAYKGGKGKGINKLREVRGLNKL